MNAEVAFRGGYTCSCVATSLPLLELVMLINGNISNSLDLYQLGWRNDVSASAGTHSQGGCTDIGQLSDECLAIERKYGWTFQHRTPAQGFSPHAHGWPNGCGHLAPSAQYQQLAWNNGRDGLVSNGPITGPGPKGTDTPHWTEGVRLMERQIMAFKDDVASEVAARIGRFPTPADFWNWAGINVSRDPRRQVLWSGAHTVSHTDRAQDELGVLAAKIDAATKAQAARDAATAKQIADLKALVNGLVAK
jgi:hypothetical protein